MIWLMLWLGVVVFAFQGMFLDPILAPESIGGYFFAGLFYLFICGAAGGVSGLIAYGIGQLYPTHPVEIERASLVAIRDKDGVSGTFFLGTGYIEGKPYYFYYKKLSSSIFQPGKVEADGSVTVYEEQRTGAELVTFANKIAYPWWAWLVSLPYPSGSTYTYAFHVPQGTIRTGYSM